MTSAKWQFVSASLCQVMGSHWTDLYPDSKFHGASMGPIWGQQDPGGPHVGPMNFAIWVAVSLLNVNMPSYQYRDSHHIDKLVPYLIYL